MSSSREITFWRSAVWPGLYVCQEFKRPRFPSQIRNTYRVVNGELPPYSHHFWLITVVTTGLVSRLLFTFWPGGFAGSYFYRSYYLISLKHHKVKFSKDTECATLRPYPKDPWFSLLEWCGQHEWNSNKRPFGKLNESVTTS
jgi:hypothetical protein